MKHNLINNINTMYLKMKEQILKTNISIKLRNDICTVSQLKKMIRPYKKLKKYTIHFHSNSNH